MLFKGSVKSLHMTEVELIAMRMYTGPVFILYNGVLRAMATDGVIRFGFDRHLIGASVRGDQNCVHPKARAIHL